MKRLSSVCLFVAAVALVALLRLDSALGVGFTLRAGEETCLSQEVIRGEYVSGSFTVQPEGRRLAVYVRDPVGTTVYHKPAASEGRFAYTAVDNGEYKACFANSVDHDGPKSVKLTFRTGAEAKPANAATKKNLRPLEVQVRHLEEVVAGIRQDEAWLARRQDEMRAVNDAVASKVLWFNVAAIAVLAGTGFLQIWYLRRYFRAKKLVSD